MVSLIVLLSVGFYICVYLYLYKESGDTRKGVERGEKGKSNIRILKKRAFKVKLTATMSKEKYIIIFIFFPFVRVVNCAGGNEQVSIRFSFLKIKMS